MERLKTELWALRFGSMAFVVLAFILQVFCLAIAIFWFFVRFPIDIASIFTFLLLISYRFTTPRLIYEKILIKEAPIVTNEKTNKNKHRR